MKQKLELVIVFPMTKKILKNLKFQLIWNVNLVKVGG